MAAVAKIASARLGGALLPAAEYFFKGGLCCFSRSCCTSAAVCSERKLDVPAAVQVASGFQPPAALVPLPPTLEPFATANSIAILRAQTAPLFQVYVHLAVGGQDSSASTPQTPARPSRASAVPGSSAAPAAESVVCTPEDGRKRVTYRCWNRNPSSRYPKKANKGARPKCRVMRKIRKRLRTGR